MLAHERRCWVLEQLNRHGSVRTSQVAQALEVAEETVRRDLDKLGAEGLLLRSHGGATRQEAHRREFALQERIGQNRAGKQRIAAAALPRIQAGQTVYFDASTTVLPLAKSLSEIPLTVVTNSLQVAHILAEKSGIDCVLLGGSVRGSSLSTGGWAAEKALEIYRIDTAFLSCRGFDPIRGASDAAEVYARLKSAVIARSCAVVMLADASKTGLASGYFFARPSEINQWITDAPLAPETLAAATAEGIRVEVAEA